MYKLLLYFLPRGERGVRGKAMPERLEGWAFDHPRDTQVERENGLDEWMQTGFSDRSYSCLTDSPLVAAVVSPSSCSFPLVSMFLSDVSPNVCSLALCALHSNFFEDFWAVNDGG